MLGLNLGIGVRQRNLILSTSATTSPPVWANRAKKTLQEPVSKVTRESSAKAARKASKRRVLSAKNVLLDFKMS